MIKFHPIATRLACGRRVVFCLLLIVLLFSTKSILAHPSPNTLIFLNASPQKVVMELQLPVPELELAFKPGLSKDPEHIISQYGPQFQEYLAAHIRAYVTRSRPWAVKIEQLKMDHGKYPESNISYWEVNALVSLTPEAGDDTRDFYLDYDVIIHQVINHAALLSIAGDWENGVLEQKTGEVQAIAWDMQHNTVPPLHIRLTKGSWWMGFSSMVSLGIRHISEGTDHLMFLLVLLLPATLLVTNGRWAGFGGTRYSIVRLLKIVTAFTIGHSLTLILGALGFVHVNSQIIEVIIAISILISAVHAVKPLFSDKEMLIAAGFGLVHGMAFATTLTDMRLTVGPLATSILGFNIGIELMQLFIIVLTIPWLIILSKRPVYKWVRIVGAAIAGTAATGWATQRIANKSNIITDLVEQLAGQAKWLLVAIALTAILLLLITRIKNEYLSRLFSKKSDQ